MRVDPSTPCVPLDASTREALERVRLYLPLDSRHPAHAALALIESTLERLEREYQEQREYADGHYRKMLAAEARAERYAKALRHELGVTHGEDTIRRIRAALIPETEQPDFWRPDGRCPEC